MRGGDGPSIQRLPFHRYRSGAYKRKIFVAKKVNIKTGDVFKRTTFSISNLWENGHHLTPSNENGISLVSVWGAAAWVDLGEAAPGYTGIHVAPGERGKLLHPLSSLQLIHKIMTDFDRPILTGCTCTWRRRGHSNCCLLVMRGRTVAELRRDWGYSLLGVLELA